MARLKIEAKNLARLSKELARRVEPAKKVIQRTVSDIRNGVPGIVADEVRTIYNIQKKEITPIKKKPKKLAGHIAVSGQSIETVTIVYEGRPLTPIHFGMTPKKLPKTKTRTNKNGETKKYRAKYKVKAKIKKGEKKVVHTDAFLGSNRGGGYIPFKRTGAGRYPIESIKTVSLPQMVDNPNVREQIKSSINDLLAKRLEHNLQTIMK